MDSIRKQVIKLLDENPLLTARNICKILGLNYRYYRSYIYNLKSKWKHSVRDEGGSIPSIHGWRGFFYVPFLDAHHKALRVKACRCGWVQSKSRNRFLQFKDSLGRLLWFETGRVNVGLNKPVNTGRAYQLICNGFGHTDLITDFRVLQNILKSVKFKSAHYVFETKVSLPKISIDLFDKEHGIRIKVGDRSHPTSVEVISKYPDWAERNERLFEGLTGFFNTYQARDSKDNYVV